MVGSSGVVPDLKVVYRQLSSKNSTYICICICLMPQLCWKESLQKNIQESSKLLLFAETNPPAYLKNTTLLSQPGLQFLHLQVGVGSAVSPHSNQALQAFLPFVCYFLGLHLPLSSSFTFCCSLFSLSTPEGLSPCRRPSPAQQGCAGVPWQVPRWCKRAGRHCLSPELLQLWHPGLQLTFAQQRRSHTPPHRPVVLYK